MPYPEDMTGGAFRQCSRRVGRILLRGEGFLVPLLPGMEEANDEKLSRQSSTGI